MTVHHYSTAPLHELLHRRADELTLTVGELADIVRIPRRTLVRVLSTPQVRWDTADRLAVALGYHPVELWPTWHDDLKEKP